MKLYILYGYCGLLLLNSFIAFIMYGIDKKRAIKNKMRIKEKHLLFIACIGGALGSFIGRIVFHHKTEKKYFSFIICLSLLLQIAGIIIQVINLKG